MMTGQDINPFTTRAIAEAYDAWYATPLGAAADRWQRQLVLSLAQPQAGERALDVGTGTGNYAIALAARGLQLTGLDASDEMLAEARQKSTSVAWQRGAAESLPFESGSFALVVSVTALEFMTDPVQALAEMHRVLAPGGRMVVGTLNALGAWGRLYAASAQDPSSPFSRARLRTPKEFLTLLAPYGPVRWSSALFVPPSGRGLRLAGLAEGFGRLFMCRRGALLVGRATK